MEDSVTKVKSYKLHARPVPGLGFCQKPQQEPAELGLKLPNSGQRQVALNTHQPICKQQNQAWCQATEPH